MQVRGGFRKGISPKRLNQMLKQTGISVEELDDVEEVVIRRADTELVFSEPTVTIMEAQGTRVYQISGTPEEHVRTRISDDDVKLVMEKAGCSEADARAALEEANGDLADAISKLCGE